MKVTHFIVWLTCLALTSVTAAQQNPFMDLVRALTNQMSQPTSLFNGPDRGGPDTLHGEVADHWFPNYAPPSGTPPAWASVSVPNWQNNEEFTFVNPVEPELPGNVILNNGLYSVSGKFLVGAIKWPHEEYLEQYVDGTITEITDDEKVPVYWVAGWRLLIPEDYPADESKVGKALIVQAGGQSPISQQFRPPWMVSMMEYADWRAAAAAKAALRLGVPVLYFGANPVEENTWKKNNTPEGYPQGGVAGYWDEARFDFSGHWSIKAPEADPLRDHPQFMYVASYIRARTFLDGFFNPTQAMGTASWSKWDEITSNNTDRYTPMTDVIVMAGSKRGHAVWLAALADPYLTAFIANGAGNPRISQFNRLAMDEQWEMREARYLAGSDSDLNEMKSPQSGVEDENQLRPASDMQSSVTHLDILYAGQAAVQLPYYDLHPVFKDRDVMKDADHPNNPQPEIWAFVTQGLQDHFWPAQDWTYWMADEVFHGAHLNFDFHSGATHAPYHQDMADAIHGFCEAKWFERPMPTIRITGIEYVLPIEGEVEQATIPLKVHAEAVIPTHANWTLDGDPEFRLCLGLRPLSDVTSRGMWSDVPRGSGSNWQYGRQTPWWEIEPTDVSQNGTVYTLVFDAVSDAYADVTSESDYFPMGFDPPYGDGLDLDGIPPNFHVAISVRVAAVHEQSGQERWPVRSSSVVELLPPWIEVPENQAFGWGDPEGMLDGDAGEE